MKVTFEPAAHEELGRIFSWIANDNPRAARELTHMGRPGLVEGTRELLEWPYIIVYKVHADRDEIVIVSVVHGAQDREGQR